MIIYTGCALITAHVRDIKSTYNNWGVKENARKRAQLDLPFRRFLSFSYICDLYSRFPLSTTFSLLREF